MQSKKDVILGYLTRTLVVRRALTSSEEQLSQYSPNLLCSICWLHKKDNFVPPLPVQWE